MNEDEWLWQHIGFLVQYRRNMSSIVSSNSEAFASELLENIEDKEFSYTSSGYVLFILFLVFHHQFMQVY